MVDKNYIVIQGWMINQLKLKGNELVLFALIYGFSQDGKSQYKGSLNYISKALNISKRTVVRLKNSLIDQGYVVRYEDETGDRFSVNFSKLSCFFGSDKSIPLGSDKSIPNIYNNNYINSSKGKMSEIFNNYDLIEHCSRTMKLKILTVKNQISVFVKHSESIDIVYSNRSELFSHFGNWMRKQKGLKDVDVDAEFLFFIEMFNKISKKKFVGTLLIKELFITALDNDFTGKQMAIAIKNMYSSSEKNKWHRKNNWEFATPEHLLKNENLNKYLNADY